MSLIAKIALTSFFSGIMLMLVSFILWLLEEECFYGDDIWVPFLVVGVLFVAIPLIGLVFYIVGYILIAIWT